MSLPGFLGSIVGHSRRLLKFEIRPEVKFVVMPGPVGDTPDYVLRGHVVLMNSEAIQTKGATIVLEGKRRTAWVERGRPDDHCMRKKPDPQREKGPPGNSPIINKDVFLHMEHALSDCHGSLPPGNHEFPFEFTLKGDTPETVEGLKENYIKYSLIATADRARLAKDLVATQSLRVIRTLGDEIEQIFDVQEIVDHETDKLICNFGTSSKVIVYGSSVIADISLMPKMEKLEFGGVKLSLKESRKIKTVPGPDKVGDKWVGLWTEEEQVAVHRMEVPVGCEETHADWQLPVYKFKAVMQLPKQLSECRQTVENNEWIEIKHNVHYSVLVRKPNGLWLDIRAQHAIRLFISPNLPIGDDDAVAVPPPEERAARDLGLLADLQTAPPLYRNHQLDCLYDDVDPRGVLTSATSTPGARTPHTSLSRYASSQNLAAFAEHQTLHPQQLRRRLEHLQEGTEETSISQNVQQQHQAPDGQDTGSNWQISQEQRNDSDGFLGISPARVVQNSSGVNSPGMPIDESSEHIEYDMNCLSLMPSYNTAVRAPVQSSFTSTPPTYEQTMSKVPRP